MPPKLKFAQSRKKFAQMLQKLIFAQMPQARKKLSNAAKIDYSNVIQSKLSCCSLTNYVGMNIRSQRIQRTTHAVL
mgnify:CR=1 FL=1